MQIYEVSREQSAASDTSNDPTCLLIKTLENLVAEVEEMAPIISCEVSQKLRSLVPTFPSRLSEDQQFRIWKVTYSIWNTCIEINTSLQEPDEEHAKLRHVASDLLVVAGSIGAVHSSLLKTFMFYFKMGTIWHKLENHAMAAACLKKATEFSNRAKDNHRTAIISQNEAKDDENFLLSLVCGKSKNSMGASAKSFGKKRARQGKGNA